jgi:hypothetical protein
MNALNRRRRRGRPRKQRLMGTMPNPSQGGPARVYYASHDRKLSPVEMVDVQQSRGAYQRRRPIRRGPYVSSTAVSIQATCPSSCAFRAGACYAMSGFPGAASRAFDVAAEGMAPSNVIEAEAAALRRAFSGNPIPRDGGRDGRQGRDLRLHVAGDVGPGRKSAELLAGACADWLERGGGLPWTYTHRWRQVPRDAWGPISVLASVESPEAANEAIEAGYVPAIVVRSVTGPKAARLPGLKRGWRLLPCPFETLGRTCVECRLCMNVDRLRELKLAIGFGVHGLNKRKVQLPVLQAGA